MRYRLGVPSAWPWTWACLQAQSLLGWRPGAPIFLHLGDRGPQFQVAVCTRPPRRHKVSASPETQKTKRTPGLLVSFSQRRKPKRGARGQGMSHIRAGALLPGALSINAKAQVSSWARLQATPQGLEAPPMGAGPRRGGGGAGRGGEKAGKWPTASGCAPCSLNPAFPRGRVIHPQRPWPAPGPRSSLKPTLKMALLLGGTEGQGGPHGALFLGGEAGSGSGGADDLSSGLKTQGSALPARHTRRAGPGSSHRPGDHCKWPQSDARAAPAAPGTHVYTAGTVQPRRRSQAHPSVRGQGEAC